MSTGDGKCLVDAAPGLLLAIGTPKDGGRLRRSAGSPPVATRLRPSLARGVPSLDPTSILGLPVAESAGHLLTPDLEGRVGPELPLDRIAGLYPADCSSPARHRTAGLPARESGSVNADRVDEVSEAEAGVLPDHPPTTIPDHHAGPDQSLQSFHEQRI
jgi:hypothetical protein